MNCGEFRVATGRQACCGGSSHVIYVPVGRLVGDVVAEIATLGQLAEDPGDVGDWVAVDCHGSDDCWCKSIDLAAGFAWRHDDQVIAWWDGTRIVWHSEVRN